MKHSLDRELTTACRSKSRVQWIALAAFVVTIASLALARADDILDRVVRFHISSSPLASALIEFSTQSGIQVDAVAGVQRLISKGVNGSLPIHAALGILLDGTGLQFSRIGADTIAFRTASVATAAGSALPLSADALDSLTVQAQRDRKKLKHDVDRFVSSAIYRPNADDSLLRWDHPVCPLVAGMTRQVGEFVLTRLSQIARSAHAPLGLETCKPNLFVIVAKNPENFLRLWWHQKPRLFNTGEGVAPVKRFIEMPRPVRVWYNASISGGDGGVVFSNLFTGLLGMSMGPTAAGTISYPVFTGPSSLGSRITHTVVREIVSAIVVVDPAQVDKLNIGQLVDYIGMVGLAEINLDKDMGEAPTILKAFNSSESPPAEMTAWDRALLHALYSTKQKERMQISEMETVALRDIESERAH